MEIRCKWCGKAVKTYPCRIGTQFFCSRRCFGLDRRKNFRHSDEAKQKMRLNCCKYWLGKKIENRSGEKHFAWKGDNAGYVAIHSWIRARKGKPKICSECGKEDKTVQWANKDHTYKRNLEDYIPLCQRCHLFYDIKNNNKQNPAENLKKYRKIMQFPQLSLKL